MKRYTIARVDGHPDWRAVPALDIDEVLWPLSAGDYMRTPPHRSSHTRQG